MLLLLCLKITLGLYGNSSVEFFMEILLTLMLTLSFGFRAEGFFTRGFVCNFFELIFGKISYDDYSFEWWIELSWIRDFRWRSGDTERYWES